MPRQEDINDSFNTLSATGVIAGNPVTIASGDIIAHTAQRGLGAMVVGQFCDRSSASGFGGLLRQQGFEDGMNAYGEMIEQHGGRLERGAAHITPSGRKTPAHLIHVAVIDDTVWESGTRTEGAKQQFDMLEKGFYNALMAAKDAGIHRLSAPALCTGNQMLDKNAASLMMSALRRYGKEEHPPMCVDFVIYDNKLTENSFREVLADEKLQTRDYADHYFGFFLRMTAPL